MAADAPAAALGDVRVPVLRRLLAAGVLHPREVVDAGVRTTVADRSNRVDVVAVGGVPVLAVKAGRPGVEQWEQGDPGHERALLRSLAGAPVPALPDVVAVLPDLLVTRFVGDGSAVSDRVRDGRFGRQEAAALVGAALGQVLASDLLAGRSALAPPGSAVPWGLRLLLERPPRFVAGHPPAAALHDELSADQRLAASLKTVASGWLPSTLVHGDVRWDNCLIDDERRRAVLIDWESAGLGDPAWDLGCAAAEHLAWGPLGPAAAVTSGDPGQLAGTALDAVEAELTVLATAYVGAGGPPARAALPRAAGYAAARLLYIAFQWTYWDQEAGSARARWLAAVAAVLLDGGRPVAARLAEAMRC